MCQVNNATMEETYKAEVVCLRKLLAEKDKEIAQLKELLKEIMTPILVYDETFGNKESFKRLSQQIDKVLK